MMKKLCSALIGGAIATIATVGPQAMADSRSVDLRPGFTQGPDAAAPRAAPGIATGYAVPMGSNGGQAGANWTSRSGNFNAGGYVRGDMNGGYATGAGVGVRF